ncbi:MAG: hypothetical protein HY840_08105 [Bacteroidetes bacterium]|nr:hypothetical protein [Bacteroidota bacterium]
MNKEREDKLANAIITLHQAIKKQGAKINLAIGELRLSYMKLDDSFNRYAASNNALLKNHETRLVRLEEKDHGSAYTVQEPEVKYKKRKKR